MPPDLLLFPFHPQYPNSTIKISYLPCIHIHRPEPSQQFSYTLGYSHQLICVNPLSMRIALLDKISSPTFRNEKGNPEKTGYQGFPFLFFYSHP